MVTLNKDKKFIVGVGLIIGAYLIGWAVPLLLIAIMKNRVLASEIGGGLWAFSWIPFLIGAALAGKEGVVWVKQKIFRMKRKQEAKDKR
jgi:cytochrome c biogenesis protein CcdA